MNIKYQRRNRYMIFDTHLIGKLLSHNLGRLQRFKGLALHLCLIVDLSQHFPKPAIAISIQMSATVCHRINGACTNDISILIRRFKLCHRNSKRITHILRAGLVSDKYRFLLLNVLFQNIILHIIFQLYKQSLILLLIRSIRHIGTQSLFRIRIIIKFTLHPKDNRTIHFPIHTAGYIRG